MNEATSTQAISALPPDVDGKALAPKDEAADEGYSRLVENEHFAEFLNKIADFATAQANAPQQWDRRRKTVQLRKYVLGEYYGIYDQGRGWVNGKTEGDGVYYDPLTATFIEDLVASLVKTKPKKNCEARDIERVDKREAARVAEKLLEYDDDHSFTPKKQQREWKWNILTAGETYRLTYFNQNKQGCGVTKDVYEPQLIQGGEKASFCPLCSSTASDETGKCASCGNPQMDEFEALGTTVTVKKGSEYMQVGDVDFDVPDALEMTVVGETDDISEALIVLRDRMIPRCVLEDALGIHDLPATGTPENLNYKQIFNDDQNSFTGTGGMKEFELLHYQELWVAPAVYTSYKFPVDTVSNSGQKVPAGTRAKEILPNGFYFSRTKKKICNLHPQSAGECLSHTVNSIGEGFHGHGEWDLNELQDQATEATSMKMNSMLLDSTQPLLAREGYVDTENFENKFGLVVPVSQEADDRTLDDIMKRVPAANPPSEAWQVGEEVKAKMQHRLGAFSTQSDAPDIKAMGTATGVAAITENTLGRRAPALQLYAQMEVEQAYQKLEMRQKYWCRKMYDSVAKDLGGDAVKWFMQCNIRQDISIKVAPNSWMPKTEAQKAIGFEKFLAVAGQIIMAKNDPKMLDEVLRKANEVYGGEINFNDFETDNVEAQLRLDKLREVGAFVEQQLADLIYDPAGGVNGQALLIAYSQTAEMLRLNHTQADPADIFFNLPMDVMFDTHAEFENAYTDWLKTAEGRGASVFVRTLARQLAEFHIQAESYRLMKIKQYSMPAKLPDLEEELAVNDATHNQEMVQTADKTEQQMLYSGIQNAMMPPAEGKTSQKPR